jgi:hypothetical protein
MRRCATRLHRRIALANTLVGRAITLPGVADAFRGHGVWVASACSGHHREPNQIIIACGDGNFYAN